MGSWNNAVWRGGGVLAANKLASFDHFTLLDHQVGKVDAPSPLGPLEAALGFDASKPDRRTSPDKGLQDLLDDVMKGTTDDEKRVKKTSFAVVDLTGPKPLYAGNMDTKALYPASMGKLMLMVGAYQLRFDLAVLAEKEKITDLEKLLERAAELWDDAEHPKKGSAKKSLRSAGPKIDLEGDHVLQLNGSRVGMGYWGKMRLENIFDPAGGVSPPKFKSDGLKFADLYYIEYPKSRKDFDTSKLNLKTKVVKGKTQIVADEGSYAFHERLRLTIGFSNNNAPRTLGRDMSLVFANSPMWRGGLYDPSTRGLWLGNPYAGKGNGWRSPPLGGNETSSNARALATLFAAIFEKKITDAASCDEMAKLLKKQASVSPTKSLFKDPDDWANVEDGVGTRSFVLDALVANGKRATVWSKLGIYNGYSDVAYVERRVGAKKLRYAIAIVDVPEDDDTRLDVTAVKVDEAIESLH